MVGAGVDCQLRSQRNSGAEEEHSVQRIQNDHDKRVNGPVRIPRGRDQVEEREHRERRHEHRIVDRGRVACERRVDYVTYEGHDEESPHELETTRISYRTVKNLCSQLIPPTHGDPTEQPANSSWLVPGRQGKVEDAEKGS